MSAEHCPRAPEILVNGFKQILIGMPHHGGEMTAAALDAPRNPAAAFRAPPRWLLAAAITLILTLAWSFKDWGNLSLLRLPDNDDMARLAQVRDWLNGQAFNDLMQYRLGPPGGASMHWSRIADAIPAFEILIFRPFLGTHGAEVAMILTYPAILFLAYLLLVARIARRLGGDAACTPALLLAALAFPTISLFIPGRIDHHALQIVLTLLLVDTIVAPPTLKQGIIGGIAAALSLAIGLEAAPEILAAMAAMGLGWLTGTRDDDRRALGFALALGGVTLALLTFARPNVWPEIWCDGFTPASTRATLTLSAAWLLMSLSGRVATTWKPRLTIAAILGLASAGIAYKTSSVCLAGPYGALDPFLQRVWMRNVSEARDLFVGQDTFGTSLAFGGLVLLGAALALTRIRDRNWRSFAIFLALSAVAAIAAIRVTYIMAGIAVIPFAAALARDGALPKRLALWVLGAGITWNLAATNLDAAFAKPLVAAKAVQQECTAAQPLRAVATQPAGTIIAPLDLGAYLTGMTRHHVVAAVYHRNNIGNLAMYRFFLAHAEQSETLAHQWGIDYVAICDDNLREDGLEPYRKGSLAEQLQSGNPPPSWLEPIPTGGAIRLYRVH